MTTKLLNDSTWDQTSPRQLFDLSAHECAACASRLPPRRNRARGDRGSRRVHDRRSGRPKIRANARRREYRADIVNRLTNDSDLRESSGSASGK